MLTEWTPSFRMITIFDVRLEMRWKGSTSDGTDISGSLIIPEVSHENVLDGVSDLSVSRILPGFFPRLFYLESNYSLSATDSCSRSTNGSLVPLRLQLLMPFSSSRN